MTAVSGGMKTSSDLGRDAMRQGKGEWGGIGWTDSSWELARGLVVVEDLPADEWPLEFPPGLQTPPPQKN